MAKRKNKIFQKDWLRFQPRGKTSPTNLYYQKLCNRVYYAISDIQDEDRFIDNFNETDIINISCFLTGYFEDVISEAGIWRAFTKKHFELYGKHLPFYETSEYFEDEINLEDIQFLMWYYYSASVPDEYYEPDDNDFIAIANAVFEIFEEEYEFAPENQFLKEFLTLPEDETDYYLVREKIDWIFMDSYLFHFHGYQFLEELKENTNTKKDDIEYVMALSNELRDMWDINKYSCLLALRGKDWLAEILGKDHKLYNDILSISKRKSSYFLYKGEDDNNVILQHLASDKIIYVTKESMETRDDLEADHTMLYMSLVMWKNEYWFSGMSNSFPYKEELIEEQKRIIESQNMFHDNRKEQIEITERNYENFLNFNNNSPIAFLEKGDDINDFLLSFNQFTNISLGKGKEVTEAANKKLKDSASGKIDIPDKLKESSCLVF